MKDIKEKPSAHMPRNNAAGKIPKAALKKAWTEAKEKSRTMLRESTSTQGDGDYTAAQDTSSVVTDTSYGFGNSFIRLPKKAPADTRWPRC